jgi:hypothetical protein
MCQAVATCFFFFFFFFFFFVIIIIGKTALFEPQPSLENSAMHMRIYVN